MMDKNADLDAVYRASGLVRWHKASLLKLILQVDQASVFSLITALTILLDKTLRSIIVRPFFKSAYSFINLLTIDNAKPKQHWC